MDVREYLKIRCLPGGQRSDCSYHSGIIFTKNLVHKDMKRRIKQPRILLLDFPVEFTRCFLLS